MMEPQFYAGNFQDRLLIRLQGQINMKNVAPLKFFFKSIAIVQFKDVIIDLKQAEYLDSTSFGILASNAVKFLKETNRKFDFINLSETLHDQFRQLGFPQICDIHRDMDVDLTDLPLIELVQKEQSINGEEILEAHRTLSELNEPNRKKFEKVVRLLSQEIESNKTGA